MTEPNPSPTPDSQKASQDPPVEAEATPKARRRRRRWPWILGSVVLLLIILVLLAPTIASTGWARSLIVSNINGRLNGRVEIKDWSLGWWSGTRVDGLVVYDATGRQILQLPHLSSGLSLWGVVTGNYKLGRTVVDGLDILISKQPDGSLNWQHLAKSSSTPEKKGASKLPNVRGELVLQDCRATYEQAKGPPVFLRSLKGDFNIPDINQPITNTLSTDVQAGSASGGGTISLDGSIAAVKNNVVSADSATADETLDIKGIDLAALPAFLLSQVNAKMAGQTNGHLAVKLTNGKSGSVQAQLGIKGASIAAEHSGASPVLSGYDLALDSAATFSSSTQGSDLKVTQLAVTDNQGLLSMTKVADQPITATLPASGNPQASGAVRLAADVKRLNDVMQALNGTQLAVRDQNGMELRSGKLQGEVALAQADAQHVKLSGNFALTNLTVANATSTPLNNETVQVTLAALTNHDLSDVQPQLDATGGLLSAHATASLALSNSGSAPAASVLDKVQQASASIEVPSIPKVQALLEALSPPSSAQPGGAARQQPPASSKSQLTGGSASIALAASHAGAALALSPTVTLAALTYKSGQRDYTIDRIELVTPSPLELSGQYSSGKPFNESVRSLHIQGAPQLKLFQGLGVTIQNLPLPVVVQDGVLRVAYAGKPAGQDLPPPGSFNGGTLDLGGCTIDLRSPHMLLTTAPNLKLVQNATLNPVFAAWSLGDILNNPAFVSASQASGVLNVTVQQCNRLPLDSTLTSSNDGIAALDMSIMGLHVGNPILDRITSQIGVDLASIQGNVKDYKVTIRNGVVQQNMQVTVGEGQRPLEVAGAVRMADKEMLPVTIHFPLKLFGIRKVPKEVQQFMPDKDVAVAMFGKTDSPRFQLQGLDVNSLVRDATQQAIQQGLLRNLPGADNTTQPSNDNPINAIEDLLKGGKKKQKK